MIPREKQLTHFHEDHKGRTVTIKYYCIPGRNESWVLQHELRLYVDQQLYAKYPLDTHYTPDAVKRTVKKQRQAWKVDGVFLEEIIHDLGKIGELLKRENGVRRGSIY